jgi:plasmid stabilization system protein ParE
MILQYTRRAKLDLERIAAYYATIEPAVFPRILREIDHSLITVLDHPKSGRPQKQAKVYKCVARQFGYIIYYRPHTKSRMIEVLRVLHGRQQRPYVDR